MNGVDNVLRRFERRENRGSDAPSCAAADMTAEESGRAEDCEFPKCSFHKALDTC